MAQIDWSILTNTPNVFSQGLQGFQLGQQGAAQRQRQALIQREADREEAQYQAGLKRQQRRQEITAGYNGNPTQARQEAVAAGDFDLAEQFAKLDTAKREEITRRGEITGKVAQQLLSQFPGDDMVEQRKAAAIAMAPRLAEYGVSPEQIAASDYTTGGLQRSLALAMTIGEANAKANADRDFGLRKADTEHDNTLADQQFAETKRSNRVNEGYAGARVGMEGQRLNLDRARLGLEGQRVEIERGKAGAAKPPTEQQAKDAFSAQRMRGAAQTIGKLEADKSFNPTLSGAGAAVGGSRARQYQSAQLEWADSLLRATTGAAATKDEIENTKRTYFPQFGDSADVVAQKADARRRVQIDLARRAGTAGATAMPTAPVRVSTPDEARALPPGTQFMTPDGRVKVR